MLDDRYSKTIVVAVALTLVVSAAAAGGAVTAQQDDPAAGNQADVSQDTSYLRVLHASPDAPAVDIMLEGPTNESEDMADDAETRDITVASDVEFSNVTEYMNVTAGTYDVTISIADQPADTLYEGNVTIEPRSVVTVAASGEFSTDAETDLELTVLQDNALDPGDEQAAVSVVHLSPDASAVDVVVTEGPTEEDDATDEGTDTEADEETDTETDEGTDADEATDTAEETETETDTETATDTETDEETVLAENVSFRDASGYVNVPAGDYTVEIREAAPDNDGTVVTTVELSVEGGQAYSAVAAGYAVPSEAPQGAELQVFPLQDATTTINLPDAGTDDATDEDTATETDTDTEEETETGEETDTGTEEGTDTGTEEETDTETGGDETDTATEAGA